MNELVGDERGIVTVTFTKEVLPEFIRILNAANAYVDNEGVRIYLSFSVDEYAPGRAVIEVHTWTEPPAEVYDADVAEG